MTPILGGDDDDDKAKAKTNFYLVRHADFTLTGKAEYLLQVQTSIGDVTIPQLGGKLLLDGRDSKVHVTDYDVGGVNVVYSTAEIFTWAKGAKNKRVLLVYGGEGETHEIALSNKLPKPTIIEGDTVKIQRRNAWIINWEVKLGRRIVNAWDLEIHLLWRNDAYQHWVLELPSAKPITNYSSPSKEMVIVRGGYLIRSASIVGTNILLTGDVNATTPLEVISAPVNDLQDITFNGQRLRTSKSKVGKLTATVAYSPPSISLPTLSKLEWKYRDSLPEIHSGYNDDEWTSLDHKDTNNTLKPETPTCLYADDYGYHGGSLIYRGHFHANGDESSIFLNVSGGVGFGHSVWLNQTFLGSWTGRGSNKTFSQTLPLANLTAEEPYTLTVLIDHMGQDEEAPGTDAIKFPRGILDYDVSGHSKSDITWKMTGNLGGEQYRDLVRGPMNEGAMFAERQGYHFPKPPSDTWERSSPFSDGIAKAGVGFYSTSFSLDIPDGYDVPMNFVFNSSNSSGSEHSGRNYRCQLFVNGYQFGKYGMLVSCPSRDIG